MICGKNLQFQPVGFVFVPSPPPRHPVLPHNTLSPYIMRVRSSCTFPFVMRILMYVVHPPVLPPSPPLNPALLHYTKPVYHGRSHFFVFTSLTSSQRFSLILNASATCPPPPPPSILRSRTLHETHRVSTTAPAAKSIIILANM